jgi:hypothetical protein
MSMYSRVVLLCGVALGACFHDGFREPHGPDSGTYPSQAGNSPQPSAGGGAEPVDAGADLPVDAGESRDAAAADGGSADLASLIERDCSETGACVTFPFDLQSCIAASTRSLTSANAQSRARFVELVQRCENTRDCDYVSCTQSVP